ncbi:MAG: DUF6986 family protein [Nocardioidaceae bacterium]
MTSPGKVEPRLGAAEMSAIEALVAPGDARTAQLYPGPGPSRQPIHTVYVPAHVVTSNLTAKWGAEARTTLSRQAATPAAFAAATRQPEDAVERVWSLLAAKLEAEPIEDLRIDLEDGYGARGDTAEDADVVAAVTAIAEAARGGDAPPFWGIRFKSLEAATRARGLRTLDLALSSVLSVGPLPAGFVVTLPKVTTLEQVIGMVEACVRLETAYELETHRLHFEIQIETAQAILSADGSANVARMLHASQGRCSGLHFGTYDYTAGLGIAAAYQSMEHPAADHAKAVMALAAAGTRARVSDGSTNVMPVGDQESVHSAWALHARLVRRHLERGFYQGWDLHPAQLPTRYLATYLFFRDGLDPVLQRLRAYVGGQEGAVMDEPATAQALAEFVRRGLHCGAVRLDEVESTAGISLDVLDALAARRVG